MITNTTIREEFTPSTPTTEFPFDVAYFNETNLNVVVINSGVTTILTLNAIENGFSIVPVNNNSMNGGIITTTSSYTDGDRLTIYRETPVTQLNEFQRGGDLPPEVLNSSLDRGVAISQELVDDLSKVIRSHDTDPMFINYELPTSTERSNEILSFDNIGSVTSIGVDGDVSTPITGNVPTTVAVKDYVDSIDVYYPNISYTSSTSFNNSPFLNPTPTNAKFNTSTGIEAIETTITPTTSPCLMVIDVTVVYSAKTTNSVVGIFDGYFEAFATSSTTHDDDGVLETQTMRVVQEVTSTSPKTYIVRVGGSGGAYAGDGSTSISINGVILEGESAYGGTSTTSITVQEFPVTI